MLKSNLKKYFEIPAIQQTTLIKTLKILFFLFAASASFAQPKYRWHIKSSPIFSNLNNVQIINDTSAIILSNQIITLKNNSWKLMSPQPSKTPSLMYVLDKNAIWTANITIYQESKLFFYNGKKWVNVYNPLANNIVSIKFKSTNYGAVCGLGEIAVYNTGKWKYLTPPSGGIFKQINFMADSTLIIIANNIGIMKYCSNKWKLIKGSQNAKLLKVYNNEAFFITNNALCKIESDSTVILSRNNLLSKITSFDISKTGNLTAVGNGGIILNYKNNHWSKLNSPVKFNLNSVKMISDTSGWIVGNEGTILKFGSRIGKNIQPVWKGFNKKTLYQFAKVVNDEYGVVFDDFNNDGFVDVFTCGLFGENHLYVNKQKQNFVNEGKERGVSGATKNKSGELNLGACAGDLDNDGNDDLYVTVLNGKNKIYKNVGNGFFVDYSSISKGVGKSNDRTNSCSFGDVDNDGDLDIFIANENSSNRLFLNNGAGIFNDVTKQVGLQSTRGGTGCSFGDIDNDGDIDLYVTNWSTKNILYKNLLIEKGKLLFKNITDTAGVGGKPYTKSNGVVFSDIDNDSDLDLYVTNRKTSNRLYINNGKGIFSDETNELIGKDSLESYGAVIEDFDGDGFKDIYLSNVGENIFYKNFQGSYFRNEKMEYNTKISGYSTGSAAGDIDNDGDLDLYIANYVGTSSSLLINKLNKKNYIKLKVIGFENNRNGIGAKIYVYKDREIGQPEQMFFFDEITAGSGYASMNQFLQTIQIKNNKYVDIKIVYPLGNIKVLSHIKAGSFITVSDVNGFRKYFLKIKQLFVRLVFDPHRLFELLKWIFILSVIFYSSFRGYKKYEWKIPFILISSLVLFIAYFIQFDLLEYENILFATVLPLTSILIIILLLHLYYERKRIKYFSVLEQNHIREKLSRDLHDDLASTISSIGIYLTLIKYSLTNDNDKLKNLLNKVETLIGDASSSITDLIWAIKPQPESLSDLLIRINENFSELFKEKSILFKSSLNNVHKTIMLEAKVKQNSYLIIKEALNNILKYADAKRVKINFEKIENKLIISIEDDGKGFEYKVAKTKGHGLTNMAKRSEEINAEFNVISKINNGTIISVVFEITQTRH